MDVFELDRRRAHYAQGLLLGFEGVSTDRIEIAFSKVARELFLAPPPWRILPFKPWGRPRSFHTDNPSMLYHDCLVAIDEKSSINNGSPALWARIFCELVDWSNVRCILHRGCGRGYYTAVMAEIVGNSGQVAFADAREDLEEKARVALGDRSNVWQYKLNAQDQFCLIVCSYGISGISRSDFQALREGGVMVAPVVNATGRGKMVTFTKEGEWLSYTSHMPCSFITDSTVENSIGDLSIKAEGRLRMNEDEDWVSLASEFVE